MSEWQPIDTAPKQGIILLANSEEVEIGFFDGGRFGLGWSTTDSYSFSPTHWMPLPEPPKT